MADGDQHIVETLIALPNEIIRYSIDLTETLEKRVDQAALQIRESLSSATWLPPSARPRPPPQHIPASSRMPPLAPKGLLLWTRDWVSEHRAISAAMVAFAATGAYLYWKRRRDFMKKRRVKRGANGLKSEVVIIAGASNTSLPRSLIHDLERRGFIVYVLVGDQAEEDVVKAEAKPDIIPLHLDVTSPRDLDISLAKLTASLNNPPDRTDSLHLAGLLLIPIDSAAYPRAPIEVLDPSFLSDALNTRVLHPITILRALQRLLIAHKSRVFVLTPTLPSALCSPFQVVDSTVVGALDSFVATLAAEMQPLAVPVVHFKLGAFEHASAGHMVLQRPVADEILTWPQDLRASYGDAYKAWVGEPTSVPGARWFATSNYGSASQRVRGTPLRELNNAVFDALTQTRDPAGIWRVGRGSWIYEIAGRIAPWGCVGWFVGLRAPSVF